MKQKTPTDPEMMENPKEPLWPLQGLCGWLGPDLSPLSRRFVEDT